MKRIQVNLENHLEIMVDPENEFSIETIQNQTFRPLTEIEKLNPYASYWVRLRLENALPQDDRFVLFLGQINYVDFYTILPSGKIEQQQTGRYIPANQKAINLGRGAQIPLLLKENQTYTYYFKVWNQDRRPLKLEPILYIPSEWEASFALRNFYEGIFQGFLWILILYQLAVFFIVKYRSYLYSLSFLFCWSLYSFSTSGIFSETILAETPSLNEFIWLITSTLTAIFYIFFIRTFVKTKKVLPKWDLLLLICLWIIISVEFICIIAIAWTFNIGYFITASRLAYLPGVFVVMGVMISIIRKNLKDSLILAYGVFLFIIFALVYIIYIMLYDSSQVSGFLIKIGFIIQNIFFTAALAQRIKLKEEENIKIAQKNVDIINNQNQFLDEKIRERTSALEEKNNEVQSQNEELQQKQEELESQRDFIERKNEELELMNDKLKSSEGILQKSMLKLRKTQESMRLQNETLEVFKQQIQSSIKSAESIQKAILPPSFKLDKLLKKYFVIYRPKDVVSGDFYWLNAFDGKIIIVAADCTGHGVPGAFMTLIGNTLLDKIIRVWNIYDPAEILTRLHIEIQTVLRQKDTHNNNGMDVVIFALEQEDNEVNITFAGAKNSLFYIPKGTDEVQVLKGTRKSLGGIQNESIQFINQKISLEKGSWLYFGSDGLEDQNNVKRKKFGLKRLKSLMGEIHSKELREQKLIIEGQLDDFMKDTHQRDDILWMGLKL